MTRPKDEQRMKVQCLKLDLMKEQEMNEMRRCSRLGDACTPFFLQFLGS